MEQMHARELRELNDKHHAEIEQLEKQLSVKESTLKQNYEEQVVDTKMHRDAEIMLDRCACTTRRRMPELT